MTKKKTKTTPKHQALSGKDKLPFVEHLYELRRRLSYVALSLVLFGGIGYSIQQKLITVLLKPAAGQQFIYTSPGGGINFLFQICIYFGVVLSIPVIMYQLFRYMQPLIPKSARKFIVRSSIFSIFLACMGLCFGYFIGLPAALHFLAHQFTTDQVKPLFTIQEFMSFVSIYLIGSAALFQIPLVLMFINRITPLKPMKLLKIERYVVLGAFIAAAIITPTPDIFNQTIIAGPIIAVYQFGIVLVWLQNHRRPHERRRLEKRDAVARAERLERRAQAKLVEALPLPAKPLIPALVIKPSDLPPASATPATTGTIGTIIQPDVAPVQSELVNRFRRSRPIQRRPIVYRQRPSMARWNDIRPVSTV